MVPYGTAAVFSILRYSAASPSPPAAARRRLRRRTATPIPRPRASDGTPPRAAGMSAYEDRRRARQQLPAEILSEDPAAELCLETIRVDAETDAAAFDYSLDGEPDREEWFSATLQVAGLGKALERLGAARGREALLACGICAGAWLFMEHPRRRLRVRSDPLSPAQVAFWQETLRGALAEFLWVNRIPFLPEVRSDELGGGRPATADAPAAESGGAGRASPAGGAEPRDVRVMVPLGGGKDALTLVELLRDSGLDCAERCTLFHLSDDQAEWRKNWRLRALHRATGIRRCLRAEFLPPRRRGGGLAGIFAEGEGQLLDCAPPWAAMVAFSAALAAAAAGCDCVAVGNERSANFGNGVTWLGRAVNHQYDKSLEWERLANAYLRTHVSPGLWYFSGLMHLWEVQIAERFCREDAAERYLPLFLSCNTPQLTNTHSRWCASCPKCAFVFLLISAWLPPARCWGVFGDNLFETPTLVPVFRSLLGIAGEEARKVVKPLECVGTPKEARLSFLKAVRRYRAAGHLGYAGRPRGRDAEGLSQPDLENGDLDVDVRPAREGESRLLPQGMQTLLDELAAQGLASVDELERELIPGDPSETLSPPWFRPAR